MLALPGEKDKMSLSSRSSVSKVSKSKTPVSVLPIKRKGWILKERPVSNKQDDLINVVK